MLLSTNSAAAAAVLIESKDVIGSDGCSQSDSAPTFVGLGFDVIRLESQPLTWAGQVGHLEHFRSYGRSLCDTLGTEGFWVDAIS